MATGHGVGVACDGWGPDQHLHSERRQGRTSDEDSAGRGRRATDLIHESQVHGLAGLLGSTQVGVVGYTMVAVSDGECKYGFNAASVREDVVTADGEPVRVSAGEHPDSFCPGRRRQLRDRYLPEVDLYPIGMLYGWQPHLPCREGARVLDAYARWSADLPDEMSSGVAFRMSHLCLRSLNHYAASP